MVLLEIHSLLSGEVSVICSSRYNVGLSAYRKIFRNITSMPPKKMSGSKHFASKPVKLLFLLRDR